MMQESIIARILDHASVTPDAAALVTGDTRISYSEIANHIRAAYRNLRNEDLQPGDRVVLAASNTLEFVVSYFAAHLARVVAVPVDAGASSARMAYIGQRVNAKRVLTAAGQAALVGDSRVDAFDGDGPRANDLADLMFTSGTTGSPKGVMLSHGNLVSGARQINAVVGTGREDVELIALPFAHSFGLGSLRCVLAQGGCVVLASGFAFPGQLIESLGKHGATGFRCVPAGLATLFRVAGDSLGQFADTLRYVELGSAPLPAADRERLVELLPNSRLCMHYGLTEATRSVYVKFHENMPGPGAVGFPAPGVEVCVVADHGEDATPGEGGEIWIRGAHVMQGYWEDPEQSNESLVGGWLRTGDHGYMDEQGCLYLSGRRRDIINAGGKKVSPVEVENALRDHPEVGDCAVAGIPDPAGISGEIVAVLVVPADKGHPPAERILKTHLRDILEPYKIPAKWVFEGRIPCTENGKVQRHLLADILSESR